MQRNNFSTGEQKGKKSSFSVPLKNYSFRIFSLSSFSLLLHYPLELRKQVGVHDLLEVIKMQNEINELRKNGKLTPEDTIRIKNLYNKLNK